MAETITFGGGQPDIKLSPRGPTERTPDTYARPAAPPPADTSIGDALKTLSGIAQGIDDQKAAKDKELAHLYQAQLSAAMKGNSGFDPTVADGVLNAVHPRVRAYVVEQYGKAQGEAAYRNWANSNEGATPPDAVTDPAAYEAWKQKAIASGLGQAGDKNLFYRNGFVQAFTQGITTRGRALDAYRNQQTTNNMVANAKANLMRASEPGASPDTTRAANPEKASALVAAAQELGVDPVHLAAIMSFETKGKFDPNMEHDVYLEPGKNPVKIAGKAQGLIGFIPDNWEKYGIHKNMTFQEQLNSVKAYLRDRASASGVDLKGLNAAGLYKLINPGFDSKTFENKLRSDGHLRNGLAFIGVNSNTPRYYEGGKGDPAKRANAAKVDATWGNPDAPDFKQKFTTVIQTQSGAKLRVHNNAAQAFQGFFKELESMGYKIKPEATSSYANRNIRGGKSKSQHAWGNAVDINAYAGNGFGKGAKTDLPKNIQEIASKYGLRWGGTFSRPDPMHFEFVGGAAAAAPADPADLSTYGQDDMGPTTVADRLGGTPKSLRGPVFDPLQANSAAKTLFRSRFFDQDGDFKALGGGKAPPHVAQMLNEEAWKVVKENAIRENDPTWLDAFPRRYMNADRITDQRTTTELIERRQKAALREKAQEDAAARKARYDANIAAAGAAIAKGDKAEYARLKMAAITSGEDVKKTVEHMDALEKAVGWGGSNLVKDPEAEALWQTRAKEVINRAAALGQPPDAALYEFVKQNQAAVAARGGNKYAFDIGGQKGMSTLIEYAKNAKNNGFILNDGSVKAAFTNYVAPVFGIDVVQDKAQIKSPLNAQIRLAYDELVMKGLVEWRKNPANAGAAAPGAYDVQVIAKESARKVIAAFAPEGVPPSDKEDGKIAPSLYPQGFTPTKPANKPSTTTNKPEPTPQKQQFKNKGTDKWLDRMR